MKFIRNWFDAVIKASWERARQRNLEEAKVVLQSPVMMTRGSSISNKSGHRRVEILDAINGKVLEIHHRDSPTKDWDISLYILREDEALADAIATCLLITSEN